MFLELFVQPQEETIRIIYYQAARLIKLLLEKNMFCFQKESFAAYLAIQLMVLEEDKISVFHKTQFTNKIAVLKDRSFICSRS